MKKGIYWFAFLSEQEQKEFRANCEDFHEYMDSEIESFDGFIDCAFFWDSTPQEAKYWLRISNRKVQ